VYTQYAMKKLALIVFVALALPGAAFAKGPSKALIAGPGIATIKISGAEGSSTPYWRFVEAAGWFEAAWGPSRLPQTPPQGELGPRYTITWIVPSSSRLRQDVYPYAKPYPLTYMPLGQKIWRSPVKGGWFAGGSKLRKALTRVGVPAQAPQLPASASHAPARDASAQQVSGSRLSNRDIGAIVAGAIILALALLFVIRAIRRPRRTIAA
jgi:hypothetical protein